MSKKKHAVYRQGDVLLAPVDNVPDTARIQRRKKGEGIILAAGEATGHHHRVRQPHARLRRTNSGARFLVVGKRGATVTHEEHDPLVLPPGAYEVLGQREYQAKAAPRRVYD